MLFIELKDNERSAYLEKLQPMIFALILDKKCVGTVAHNTKNPLLYNPKKCKFAVKYNNKYYYIDKNKKLMKIKSSKDELYHIFKNTYKNELFYFTMPSITSKVK